MTKKEKLIYLAGILDGEGCLIPYKNNGGYRRSHTARCVVRHTSKKLIDWLRTNFGGHCSIQIREGNRKTQYTWRLRYKEMKEVLTGVMPYLIVKKKEAKQSLKIVLNSKRYAE